MLVTHNQPLTRLINDILTIYSSLDADIVSLDTKISANRMDIINIITWLQTHHGYPTENYRTDIYKCQSNMLNISLMEQSNITIKLMLC